MTISPLEPVNDKESQCPRCAKSFVCGVKQGCDKCWCMDLPAVMPVTTESSCFCPDCLAQAISDRKSNGSHPFEAK